MSNSLRPHRRQPIRLHCLWDSPGKNTGAGCHFLPQCMKVNSESEVTQSCPTLLGGSKITADGDCSHEIKRHLVLGRKVMTNLDSILKNRDYFSNRGPSSQSSGFSGSHLWIWELDHIESQVLKNWCFWTVVWRRLLRVSWAARRPNQSILKEINLEYSVEGLMLKLKLSILWPPDAKSRLIRKDPDAGKDWRQEEKGTPEDEMVGWHHWLDGHEFEQTLGDSRGQRSLACYSPWGHKESDTA